MFSQIINKHIQRTLKKYIQINASIRIFWKYIFGCHRDTCCGTIPEYIFEYISCWLSIMYPCEIITEYVTLWVFLDIYRRYIVQLYYQIYSIVYRLEYISDYISMDRVNNLFSNIFTEHRCILSIKYPCDIHTNMSHCEYSWIYTDDTSFN
jgi:hypothetical protein